MNKPAEMIQPKLAFLTIPVFYLLLMVPWNLSGDDDLVAETLKGNLIGLIDGEISDVELAGAPEYYVLYSSASW